MRIATCLTTLRVLVSCARIASLFCCLTVLAKGAEVADGAGLPPGAVARLGSPRFQHGGTITCLAVSPDGKLAATGGAWDFRHQPQGWGICFWEMATGKKIRELRAPAENISCLGFSPDGRTLAAGCGPVVSFWDTATGKELRRYTQHKDQVFFLRFSADGKTVFSGNRSATIHQVDLATGRKLCALIPWPEKQPRFGDGLAAESCDAFAVSDDGKTLVWQMHTFRKSGVGERDLLRIRDLHTGAVREVRGPPAAFGKLALAPNGQVAATGLGGVWLWDTVKGRLLRSLGQQLANVRGLTFSPDGQFIVSRHADAVLRLWDVKTGQLRQTFAGPEEEGRSDTHPEPRPFAFTPDGKTLLMGTPSGLLSWQVKTGRELHLSSGHQRPIRHLAFSAKGRTLTSTDKTTSCRWDTRTWKEMGCFQLWRMAGDAEHSLAVSNDLQQFLTQSSDKTVRLCESATHKEVHRWRVGNQDLGYGLFAPDGRSAVVGNRERRTFIGSILDLASGKVQAPLCFRSIVALPIYSPDSALLAWAAEDHTVHLVNALTGVEVRELKDPEDSGGWRDEEVQLVFSPGGDFVATKLAAPPHPHPVHIWHIQSGTPLRGARVPLREVRSTLSGGLAISPDGRILATGQNGETAIRLWEVASGQEFRCLKGHGDSVLSLTFSADGSTLVSGSRDGTALVWDLYPKWPKKTKLSATELTSLWDDMRGDAPAAVEAIRLLSDVPMQSVPFLKERLRPVETVSKARVQQLIRDLDSDEFQVRDNGSRKLALWGERVEADLRKVLTERPSPEVRRRIKLLLEDLRENAQMRAAEQLRALRSLASLEYAATTEANELLASLSRGAADAPLTHEAKAALQRLSKRR